jgi:hypothetical protein
MITTSQKISGFLSLVIPISTITIAPVPTTRFAQLIQNIGNASSTPVQDPNFGMMLWNLISVYPDALGQIAWVILFAIPFIMMFIAGSDMRLPAILGILASIYIFLKLPQSYIVFGVGCFMICLAALMYSLYRRAY